MLYDDTRKPSTALVSSQFNSSALDPYPGYTTLSIFCDIFLLNWKADPLFLSLPLSSSLFLAFPLSENSHLRHMNHSIGRTTMTSTSTSTRKVIKRSQRTRSCNHFVQTCIDALAHGDTPKKSPIHGPTSMRRWSFSHTHTKTYF